MKNAFLFLLITLFMVSSVDIQGKKKKDKIEQENSKPAFHINYRYWDKQVINYCGDQNFPENSFKGYEEAVMQGYQTIKCDIAFSKDDVAILSCSPKINKCSTGKGLTTDYTINELLYFDFGVKTNAKFKGTSVTTLLEILMLCRRNNIMLELDCSDKRRVPNSKYKILYDLTKRFGMLGSTIFCDNAENLKTLLDIDSNVIISITQCIENKDIDKALEVAERAQAADFSVRQSFASQAFIDYIHSKGYPVKIWTVENIDDMKLLVKMRADRIVSRTLGPRFDYRIVEQKPED